MATARFGVTGSEFINNQSEFGIFLRHALKSGQSGVQTGNLDAWTNYKFGGRTFSETASVAATTTTTHTLSGHTTVDFLAVWNTGDESIRCEWYTQKGRQAALGNLDINSASPDTIIKAGVVWTTTPEWAETGDWAYVDANAADAGNQGTFHLIQTAATTTLTLAQDTTITANGDDDTALVYILRKNCIILPPGGAFSVMGGHSAAPSVDIIFGTGNLSLTGVGTAGTCQVAKLYT